MDSDSYGDGWIGGTEVFVTERETHSLLLGPDGEPLQYHDEPFGFDLRPQAQKDRT